MALTLSVTAVAVAAGLSAPAAGAAARPDAPRPAHVSTVTRIEDATARAVAASLADAGWRAQLRTAVLKSGEVDLRAVTGRAGATAGHRLTPAIAAADRRIAATKGLGGGVGSLLRLRLGTDAMRDRLTPGARPLVAVAAKQDGATTVTAYDSRGRAHTLDARTAPRQAVYVIDIDGTKAMAAGLDVLDKQLASKGLAPVARAASGATAAAAGFHTTKVDAVRLSDDEEPWILGNAEIFSLVSGFGQDGKVRVDSVAMPYLDNDGHTYYPNQILVNWSSYKYNLADVVMMEDDGDANYATLAKALADALLTITDLGAYIPLVNAILDALPGSWYTNDADYVDSWYTLGVNSSGTLNGARGNGWLQVSPYFVTQL